MATVVCRQWDRHSAVSLVDVSTGGREPADANATAHGWLTEIAEHQIALVANEGRLELWIDGTALDLAVVELEWSTGDWSADVAPISRLIGSDPTSGETRYSLDYPDPCWPIALIDPTFDEIDHDMMDLLYFVAQQAGDRMWPATYLAHLERGIAPPAS